MFHILQGFFFIFLFLKREGTSENHYLKNIKIRTLSPSRKECWMYGMLFPWVKAVVTAIAAVCVCERENFQMYLTQSGLCWSVSGFLHVFH